MDQKNNIDEQHFDVADNPSATSKGERNATPVTPPDAQCKDGRPFKKHSKATTGEFKTPADFVEEKHAVAGETQVFDCLPQVEALTTEIQLRNTMKDKRTTRVRYARNTQLFSVSANAHGTWCTQTSQL